MQKFPPACYISHCSLVAFTALSHILVHLCVCSFMFKPGWFLRQSRATSPLGISYVYTVVSCCPVIWRTFNLAGFSGSQELPVSGESVICTQSSPVVQLSGGPLTWLVSQAVRSYQSLGNQLCVHSGLLLSSYLGDL